MYLYNHVIIPLPLQDIDLEIKEKNKYFERGPVSPFEFDEEVPVIHLKLPEKPVLGWAMKILNSDKVYSLI